MKKVGTKEIAPSQRTKTVIYPYHYDVKGKSRTIQPLSEKFSKRYTEYRRQWEENPKNQIVSDFPLHLDIEASGRCNLMCQNCYRYSRRTDIGDMDFDLFKKIIDEGKNNDLYAVNPSLMGEPFLHPQLMNMVSYAKSNNVLDVQINTNGTLIDEEMSKKILENGSLDTIIFSVDAITKETYNKIKCGSDFKLVNKNIEYLVDLKEEKGCRKPKVIVQMIDQKQTHDELLDFIYYWRTKADGVRIATFQSPDGNPNDKRRAQSIPETIFPCPQLWQRLTITWDGTVYPCIGDNAGREPLGNVKETSIYDIWHSERLNYLREKHSRYEANDIEACLHCDLNKVPKRIKTYKQNLKD